MRKAMAAMAGDDIAFIYLRGSDPAGSACPQCLSAPKCAPIGSTNCVKRINGQFAVALWDDRLREWEFQRSKPKD